MWTINFPQHHPIRDGHPYSTASVTYYRQHESPYIATFTKSARSSILGAEALIHHDHDQRQKGFEAANFVFGWMES